jgi:pimeloyl-ACP methyl ester carboxylesterase
MQTLRSWRAAVRKRLAAALALLAIASLTLAACNSDGGGPSTGRGVLFDAEDGLVLHGRVYGEKTGTTAVILAHELDRNQNVWSRLAEHLAARGFQVLTFDFRGHGESPGQKEVGVADGDVAAAVRFLRRLNQARPIVLVGASMGGTAVLKVASRGEVKGVVTLSAPVSVRGLSALPDVERIVAPKLFIAAEGDGRYAQNARRLFDQAKDPKELKLFPGSAHGSDLLKGDGGLAVRDYLGQFLEKGR